MNNKQNSVTNNENHINKHNQHFLNDKKILDLIINNSNIQKTDFVLEIGGGKGILSEQLAKKTENLTIVELDKEMMPFLEKIHRTNPKIKILNQNILVCIHKLKFNKIVANIPYIISEPLIKKIWRLDIDTITLLVGTNFYDILNSENKISYITNCFYELKLISKVPKEAFEPQPKVESAIIKLIKKDPQTKKQKITAELVIQGDKKIKNALENILTNNGLTKKEAKQKIKELNLTRIENKSILALSQQDFEELLKKTELI